MAVLTEGNHRIIVEFCESVILQIQLSSTRSVERFIFLRLVWLLLLFENIPIGLNFLSVTELVVGVQNEGQCLC